MLCLIARRPELHRRPRPGRRGRRRGDVPGDGHPAAGAAGDLRPLGVLAEATRVRLARAHRVRLLGEGRPLDRPASADGLDRHRGGTAVACLGLFQLDATGLSSEEQYTQRVDSIVGQEVLADHGLVDSSNTRSRSSPTPGRPSRSPRRWRKCDGLGEPSDPRDPGGTSPGHWRTITADAASQASFDTVREVRDAVHDVDGADAQVGGTPRSILDIETPRRATTR